MPVKLTVAGSIPQVADWHWAALAAAAADGDGQRDDPGQQPGRAGHGAELGPLGVQGLAQQITRRSDPGGEAHASLRRSR